jgi:molybdopterin synthase sulfur carrier subunit
MSDGAAPPAAAPARSIRPALVRLAPLLMTHFPTADPVVAIEAETVDALADELDRRWPGMRDCLCDTTPALRRHINVFVEGRRVGLFAAIPPGADVYIVTAISGG